jgi:hypothetical protein
MGKLELSDEERKARSDRMRRLHAEGKAGAQFGHLGGRPRQKRAAELAAEKIAAEGEELYRILKEKIDSDSEKISLDALRFAYELEERERKANVEEEVRYEQLKHAELAELVIGNLVELIEAGQIDLGDIVEVEGVEVRELDGPSEDDGFAQEET